MKKIYVPLFWKFSIGIIGLVILFGGINILLIQNRVYSALEAETEKRVHFISHNIADQIVDPLLYSDYVRVQEILSSAKLNDPSIAYIFILSPDNEVLVHSFDDGFPIGLIDANPLQSGKKESVQIIVPKSGEGEIIRDIAAPIMEGRLGVVRVGISEREIVEATHNTIQVLRYMVGVFILIGIVGAFVFAQFLNRPIKSITQIAENLDLETFQHSGPNTVKIRDKLWGKFPLPFRAMDEIDLLADKFNEMVNRLAMAYSELQEAHKSMMQSEKLASIGTLASGIAHEVNNPIAGILNCIRRISRNPQNLPQNEKYLKMMEEAAIKIEHVVRGLLDFARNDQLHIESFHFEEILEKALLLVGPQLEKYRISIRKELAPNLPELKASPSHIQQVLVNLLLNSIDAIQERCQQEPHCPKNILIQAYVTRKPDEFIIKIHDSGAGIPEEVRKFIFDPFFTTKQVGKGTGLGLAVSMKIMQMHNGKIYLEKSTNSGSIFTMQIPLEGQYKTEVDIHVPVESVRS